MDLTKLLSEPQEIKLRGFAFGRECDGSLDVEKDKVTMRLGNTQVYTYYGSPVASAPALEAEFERYKVTV